MYVLHNADVKNRRMSHMLGDSIYPDWDLCIKTKKCTTTVEEKRFSRNPEAERKNMQRLFGVVTHDGPFGKVGLKYCVGNLGHGNWTT